VGRSFRIESSLISHQVPINTKFNESDQHKMQGTAYHGLEDALRGITPWYQSYLPLGVGHGASIDGKKVMVGDLRREYHSLAKTYPESNERRAAALVTFMRPLASAALMRVMDYCSCDAVMTMGKQKDHLFWRVLGRNIEQECLAQHCTNATELQVGSIYFCMDLTDYGLRRL